MASRPVLTWQRKLLFSAPFAMAAVAVAIWIARPPGDASPEDHVMVAVIDSDRPVVDGQRPRWREDDCAWTRRYYGERWREGFGECNRHDWVSGEVRLDRGVLVSSPLPASKPRGERWIGTFGGSSVEGYVDNGREESWPRYLESKLGPGNRVLNFGMLGATSTPARMRFEGEGLAHGIDAAVIYTGANDLLQCELFTPVTENVLREFLRDGEASRFETLDPWFSEHLSEWSRIRERLLALMRTELAVVLARLPEILASDLEDPGAGPRWFEAHREWWREHAQAAHDFEFFLSDNEVGFDILRDTALAHHSQEIVARAQANEPIGLVLDLQRIDQSFLGTVPPRLVDQWIVLRELRRFLELASANGVEPWLVVPPYGARCRAVWAHGCPLYPLEAEDLAAYLLNAAAPAIEALAVEHGALGANVPALLAFEGDACAGFVDGVHLGDAALHRLATLLAERLG